MDKVDRAMYVLVSQFFKSGTLGQKTEEMNQFQGGTAEHAPAILEIIAAVPAATESLSSVAIALAASDEILLCAAQVLSCLELQPSQYKCMQMRSNTCK